MSKNLECKKDALMCCLIAGVSFIFVFLCSISTSPFYTDGYARGFEGGDSAQYLTMGKEWLSGKVPYRDIFDHKGPIIYFTNLLGFAICGTPAAVLYLCEKKHKMALYCTLCFALETYLFLAARSTGIIL